MAGNVDGVALPVAEDLFELGAGLFVGHGVPVAVKLIGRHGAHPGGGGQSVGGQLDVAQTKSGADVRLVGRLVCAEPDASVRRNTLSCNAIGCRRPGRGG